MLLASPRAQLLDRLRAEISGMGGPARVGSMLPFGIAALDDRLADHGLATSLHEFTSASSDLAEDAAATLFTAGIAARFAQTHGSVAWAVSRFDLYAPGLSQAGLAAGRTFYIECREDADVLAVMEDAVRSKALAAVVGEVKRASMTATRRLQLAAAESATPVLLLRRWHRMGTCPLAEASAATTRWRVACASSPPRTIPGVSRACWDVALVRQRNGDPFTLTVEACDAQGRLALSAVAADRTAPAAGAITQYA